MTGYHLIIQNGYRGSKALAQICVPRIVLVATQHPGNIGAAARAMKTMGLNDLALVAPLRWPDSVGFDRAVGAEDLLLAAPVYPNLSAAVADCTYVAGCTARTRRVALQTHAPAEVATQLRQYSAAGQRVAIVFGRERTGLTNEELQVCQIAIHIPTSPSFRSLNLAAAVQIIAYELWLAQAHSPRSAPLAPPLLANHQQLEHFYAHWQTVLDRIDFHKGRRPTAALHQLRRLFAKAHLTEREVQFLRGILSDAQRHMDTGQPSSPASSRPNIQPIQSNPSQEQ